MQQPMQQKDPLVIDQIVGKLLLVRLDIGTYHGISRNPFETSEFRDELYTPGALRLMDRVHLRPFPKHKARAIKACLDVGTRFMGGYAIPEDKIESLHAELKEIRDEFEADRANFLSNLDSYVDDWASKWEKKDPSKADEIRAKRPDHAYVARQIHYRVATVRVIAEMVENGINDGFEHEVGSLVWNIANEIAQDVKTTWNPINGKTSQRQRTGLLSRVIKKTDSLSFIDSRIGRIRDMVQQVYDSLPTTGAIEGKDFLVLQGLIGILSDPRKFLSNDALTIEIAAEENSSPATGTVHVDDAVADNAVSTAAQSEDKSTPTYAW